MGYKPCMISTLVGAMQLSTRLVPAARLEPKTVHARNRFYPTVPVEFSGSLVCVFLLLSAV
jgi:hypothetical protein